MVHIVQPSTTIPVTDHDPRDVADDASSVFTVVPVAAIPTTGATAEDIPASMLPESAVQASPEPYKPRRARVIAIANQKGGSGKTSSVLGLGGALAGDGFKVLVIDIDEQANATAGLGEEPSEAGSYFVFIDDEAEPEKAVITTRHEGIHLMPAHQKLAEVPTALSSGEQFATHKILATAIDQISDQYDFILIDCPPSLQILTVNGLFAADEIFVPVNPGFFDLIGLKKLSTTIKRVRTRLDRPDLEIQYVVLINFHPGRANSRHAYEALKGAFGDRVIDTAQPDLAKKSWYGSGVPTDGKVSSSHSAGVPITKYSKSSRAAAAYRLIAKVVQQRSITRS